MKKISPYGKDSYANKLIGKLSKRKPVIINYMINSTHTDLDYHNSSCDFRVKISDLAGVKNVNTATFIGGMIPNFISGGSIPQVPYLLLVLEELNGNVYSNSLKSRVFAIITWKTGDILSSSQYLSVKSSYSEPYEFQTKGKLLELGVKILDPDGNTFSFGNDILQAASFSNASPTVVTSNSHGLSNGDIVVVKNFTNASTQSIRDLIERKAGWVVANVTANDFELTGLDLSNESDPQNETGVEDAYDLGRDMTIVRYPAGYLTNGWNPAISSITTGVNTTIDIGLPHGLANGQKVKITGFNNGSTQLINQLINQVHVVSSATATTFSIAVDTTSESAQQQLTGTKVPFTLGSEAKIIVKNLQVSLNIVFEDTNRGFTESY